MRFNFSVMIFIFPPLIKDIWNYVWVTGYPEGMVRHAPCTRGASPSRCLACACRARPWWAESQRCQKTGCHSSVKLSTFPHTSYTLCYSDSMLLSNENMFKIAFGTSLNVMKAAQAPWKLSLNGRMEKRSADENMEAIWSPVEMLI